MAIEISGLPGRSIQDSGDSSGLAATNDSTKNTAAAATASSGGNDKFSMTSSAMQLHALEDKIAELPVVDVQKVSDVQRAMATGALEIRDADAANNLLEIEKSFSG